MIKTTLCYIEKNGAYLMLHRTKKKSDINSGKWIGIGGKFLPGETPDECLIREAKEETGLTLTGYELKGIVTFISDIYNNEEMYLYTCNEFEGELTECDEGELEWIKKDRIFSLPLWDGDRIFLSFLFENEPFFKLHLEYRDNTLVKAYTDKKTLDIHI